MLIHMGATASSGHYYSIIKGPSGQWLKFDDNRVSVVKEDEIDDECFGGEVKGSQKDVYGTVRYITKEKSWNAYLVFYELDAATAPPPLTEEQRKAGAGAEEKKDGEGEGEAEDEEAPMSEEDKVAVLETQAQEVQVREGSE